jgi:hypothetical protein
MANTKNFETVIRVKSAEDLDLAVAVEDEEFNAKIACRSTNLVPPPASPKWN